MSQFVDVVSHGLAIFSFVVGAIVVFCVLFLLAVRIGNVITDLFKITDTIIHFVRTNRTMKGGWKAHIREAQEHQIRAMDMEAELLWFKGLWKQHDEKPSELTRARLMMAMRDQLTFRNDPEMRGIRHDHRG